jgi:hypothetical protein
VTLTPADQDRGLPAAVRQRRRISNHDVAAGAPVHMEATPLEGRPNASNSARTNRSRFRPVEDHLLLGSHWTAPHGRWPDGGLPPLSRPAPP